jgi:hypothetical protein
MYKFQTFRTFGGLTNVVCTGNEHDPIEEKLLRNYDHSIVFAYVCGIRKVIIYWIFLSQGSFKS